MMAVPPLQFQPGGAVGCLAGAEATVAGFPAVGGGSGALWIVERFGETEPVTSCEGCGALALNGLTLNRWVSSLQLTAATAIVAKMARRNRRGERPGSTTQRISFPTRTRQDERAVNATRVNKLLSFQDFFNPNRMWPISDKFARLASCPGRAERDPGSRFLVPSNRDPASAGKVAAPCP